VGDETVLPGGELEEGRVVHRAPDTEFAAS
jgi:hypothetical protein